MSRTLGWPRRARSAVGGIAGDSRRAGPAARAAHDEATAEAAVVTSARRVRGRLAHVSVSAALRAGAWVGLVLGLVIGAPLGAFVAWLAGAIVTWQRDLSLTLGIARSLLPFGDQIAVLRTISGAWFLVVPAVAIVAAAITAVVLSLVGGILAAAYNAAGGVASIVVDLERADALTDAIGSDATIARDGSTAAGRPGRESGSERTASLEPQEASGAGGASATHEPFDRAGEGPEDGRREVVRRRRRGTDRLEEERGPDRGG
jgi:hypothetical protein